jgi:hypothetical protein
MTAEAKPLVPTTGEISTGSADHLWALVRRANQGDQKSLALLQQALSGPQGDQLVQSCGNLARQAEQGILESSMGESEGSQEIVRETLERMREDLGWHGSPRIEQLLIERVVLTWLQLHAAELAQAQSPQQNLRLARFIDERIERLEKRHVSAIKSLATVRRLKVHSVALR